MSPPFYLSLMFELRVKNLSKSFGSNRVLEKLNLSHEGGILGISGPNGSGKSTLLRCLGGLLSPDSGSAEWMENGRRLEAGELKGKLGYAAPYISLYEELSLTENLVFILKLRKEPVDRESLEELLGWVGLDEAIGRPYGKLSTGQQQRARLASALVHRPGLLLLDEPGSNLDEEGHRLVRQIARRYDDRSRLLVIASNNPDELEICERVFSVEGK